MRIPYAFMLTGNRWTVHFKSKSEMGPNYGMCHEATNEIWIWVKLRERKRLQTFIHEAAHAVLYTMGHDEHDEVMVEAISQLVYQLLITGEDNEGTEVGTEK